jgi:hypothetical protein
MFLILYVTSEVFSCFKSNRKVYKIFFSISVKVFVAMCRYEVKSCIKNSGISFPLFLNSWTYMYLG